MDSRIKGAFAAVRAEEALKESTLDFLEQYRSGKRARRGWWAGQRLALAAAAEAGLSYGKYRAYLALRELDPAVTPEAVRGMSMRELRQWMEALSAGDSTDSSGGESAAAGDTASGTGGTVTGNGTAAGDTAGGSGQGWGGHHEEDHGHSGQGHGYGRTEGGAG